MEFKDHTSFLYSNPPNYLTDQSIFVANPIVVENSSHLLHYKKSRCDNLFYHHNPTGSQTDRPTFSPASGVDVPQLVHSGTSTLFRKRVLSSYETPCPKRINKVSTNVQEAVCERISADLRGLTTAAASHITSQQPRGLCVECLPHRDNHGKMNLKKRVKKKKTRRGKKKNRKFMKKRVQVCDPVNTQRGIQNKTKDDEENDLIVIAKQKSGPIYATNKGESRFLGRGSFGIVYRGFRIEATATIPDEHLGLVPKEVAMLNKMKGHPNAIQLIDYIEIPQFVAIVTERSLNSKDLFEYQEQLSSPLSENKSRKIIKQLTNVLLSMEKKNTIHRDVKAENVLLNLDNGQVKLIDFGLATVFKPGVPFKTFSGTRANTPPEFISTGQYEGPKDTVWTVGLLLYSLVCGYEAFQGMMDAAIRPVNIPPHLSSDLKDLLLGTLKRNPDRRLTLEQVHNHPWITTPTNSLCLPFGYRRCFKQKY